MSGENLMASFASFGFSIPLPAVDHVFSGFEFLGFILVTAIPFGVYDLVEAMDNVESAEAAGDTYSTTEAITAEGAISAVGTLLGSPFANAVYIGHPGWKSMGGRIGYSIATGAFVLSLAWFGILAVFLNLVPVVAIAPILLYIGMLIGAQAFQTTPLTHAPAIVLGLVPHLAAWAKTLIDGALGAAGVAVTPELVAGMATNGVLYEGLAHPRQRRDPHGADPRGDRRLRHRAQVRLRRRLRRRGRRADLLRVHARTGRRLRGHADGRLRLSDGRRALCRLLAAELGREPGETIEPPSVAQPAE
jgi:hypothetical protein